MDRGAWWATVHGVAESRTWQTWLSTHSFINTGRRHKTPGPEAKDFITQWHRSRVSGFSCGSSLSPNSHRVIQRGLFAHAECCMTGEIPSAWGTQIHYSDQWGSLHFAPEENVLSSKAAFYTDILEKLLQKFAHEMCRKMSPVEKLSWKNVISVPTAALHPFCTAIFRLPSQLECSGPLCL